jgi:uracil-DNA glycosylase family 4
MAVEATEQLRAYVEYLRDLGIHEFYRQGDPLPLEEQATLLGAVAPAQVQAAPVSAPVAAARPAPVVPALSTTPVFPSASPRAVPSAPLSVPTPPAASRPAPISVPSAPPLVASAADPLESIAIPKPVSFDELVALPTERCAPAAKAAALEAIRTEIGDCTRCPLAYAGRHNIVFGDGDPNARLMFVGEGPGADEDAQGLPFVGKAGQLLNNMIGAMGLKREQVYIANIVKCRPPANRVPEPVEANTCSPFLLQQIDVIQPQVIVALGATAATYVLGVRQSLASLRGSWHSCRGAKVAVTYHPAFLLRDPRQKGEAWKDLQRVMVELGLKPQAKA